MENKQIEINVLNSAIYNFQSVMKTPRASISAKYNAALALKKAAGLNTNLLTDGILRGLEPGENDDEEMIRAKKQEFDKRRDEMIELAETKLEELTTELGKYRENQELRQRQAEMEKQHEEELKQKEAQHEEELRQQQAESYKQREKEAADVKHKMEERAANAAVEKADVATSANVETYFDKLDNMVKSAKTLELLSKLPPAEFAMLSPETQMAVLNWQQLQQEVKDHRRRPLRPFKKQERLAIKAPVKLSAMLRRELYGTT